MSADLKINDPPMIFNAYVENASMAVGYGADSGFCNLSLVFEDDGPLRSSDKDSNFPNVGTACGFKFGECKFGGIFQRYTHKKSIDGYRYDVVIESPGKWLDGIQVILDHFQGTRYTKFGTADSITNQLDNIWNPFAIRENYEYGGIFGGSNINSVGFPAKDALTLIQEISQGLHPFGGPAHFGDSYYEVDLSEVIEIVPDYFRLGGDILSLSSIIQECCDVALHDYIVYIKPKNGEIESGIIENPIIKVKVINKSFQADSDFIKTTVNNYEKQGVLVSADHGKEFPDIVTQRLIIGGAASRIAVVQASGPPQAFPIWGKKPDGFGGETYLVGDGWEMDSNVPLWIKFTGSQYNTNVLEIRCAMSSFDTWILYNILKNSSFPFFSNMALTDYHIEGLINGTITISQLLNLTKDTADYYSQIYAGINFTEFLNKIYDEIKQAGEEYYGRKFMVKLPAEPGGVANNIKFVTEDYQYITSWVISSSAWSNDQPFRDLAFYDGDGRLKHTAIWEYNEKYDYSALGSEYDLGTKWASGVGTYKVNVDQDLFWFQGSPYGVLEIPPVDGYDDITTQQYGLYHLMKLIRNQEPNINIMAAFGAEAGPLSYEIKPRRIGPKTVGIAQESTRYTWGPWWWVSDKRGKAEARVEDNLKPETFGSFSTLDDVGFAYANTAGATINSVESGYVELAEIPSSNLAEKFAGSGPYVTNIAINIGIDGIKTTYKFNTWTPQFGKLAKYNADRIARINKNFIRFMQDKRSRWTKPPFAKKEFKGMGINSTPNMRWGGWTHPISNIISGFILNENQDGKKMTSVISGHGANASIGLQGPHKDKAHFNSLEQVNSPIKITKVNENVVAAEKTRPLPTAVDLNPYFPPIDGIYKLPEDKAVTDYSIAGIGSDRENQDLQHPTNKDIDSVQVMSALRGPVLLSGWGYDLVESPTPHKAGAREFLDNTTIDRTLWKSGPLHLMWDEEREVWAGGLNFLEGVLKTNITAPTSPDKFTSFTINVRRQQFNRNGATGLLQGWNDESEEITCRNRDPSLKITNKPGKILVIVMRINYEWRPIWVSCPDDITEG